MRRYTGTTASQPTMHSFYVYALKDPERVFMYTETMFDGELVQSEEELEFTRAEWEELIGRIKETKSPIPLFEMLEVKLKGHPVVPASFSEPTDADELTVERGGAELRDTYASLKTFVDGVCSDMFEFNNLLENTVEAV